MNSAPKITAMPTSEQRRGLSPRSRSSSRRRRTSQAMQQTHASEAELQHHAAPGGVQGRRRCLQIRSPTQQGYTHVFASKSRRRARWPRQRRGPSREMLARPVIKSNPADDITEDVVKGSSSGNVKPRRRRSLRQRHSAPAPAVANKPPFPSCETSRPARTFYFRSPMPRVAIAAWDVVTPDMLCSRLRRHAFPVRGISARQFGHQARCAPQRDGQAGPNSLFRLVTSRPTGPRHNPVKWSRFVHLR